MLIYGNTPGDIRKMMWRRRYRFLTVAVLILVAVTLMGCTKNKPSLKALDTFWDALGGNTKNLVDNTK